MFSRLVTPTRSILKSASRLPASTLPAQYNCVRSYSSRLSTFYHNVLRDDLMVLTYTHPNPEEEKAPVVESSNNDHEHSQEVKGTPPNPKRTHTILRPKKPRVPEPTPNNQPFIKEVTVHMRVSEAVLNKHNLLSAIMAMQCITGKRPEIIKAVNDAAPWKLRRGMAIGTKVTLEGDAMYEFLDKLIEVVLPRLKEWNGLLMNAGDGQGNISLGFEPTALGLFPEIEVAYDMFPLITGFEVHIHTTAVRNPTGRLLLSGFGIPFLHARDPSKITKKDASSSDSSTSPENSLP